MNEMTSLGLGRWSWESMALGGERGPSLGGHGGATAAEGIEIERQAVEGESALLVVRSRGHRGFCLPACCSAPSASRVSPRSLSSRHRAWRRRPA